MKWIIFILISLGYLTIACGSHGDDGDSSCECDDDGDDDHRGHHCKCDEDHQYISMLCAGLIMAGVVVVTGAVIGFCVYNKMSKSKRTKTYPGDFASTIIQDIKQPIPDVDDRTSVPVSAPPIYSTIPYIPPGGALPYIPPGGALPYIPPGGALPLPPPYTPTEDKY